VLLRASDTGGCVRGRDLRAQLAAGERVYGLALEGFGQPKWPRLFSSLGLDFVFMDNEHNPLNRETCAWAAQAYAAHGVAPLLRIPEPSATYATMMLDLGAHGVIAPYVETVEQVRQLVGAVRYRPLKGEALRRALDGHGFPSQGTATYLERFNPDAVLVIMIESPTGATFLPDLLAVGGVDAVLVGPHDFSVSHGIPEAFDHPIFEAALQRVIEVCRKRGVAVGVHHLAGPLARERCWIEWGCNFIVHKSDTALIAEGILNEIGAVRETLGDNIAKRQDPPWPLDPLGRRATEVL
jgi:2-keto-3-deoxy-L-rhamnonate aldolase RhmA